MRIPRRSFRVALMVGFLAFATSAQSDDDDRIYPCALQAQSLCANHDYIVSIEGTVTANGEPAADAIVILQAEGKKDNSGDPYSSFSDALGRFVFVGLKAGEYALSVVNGGYETFKTTVTVKATRTLKLNKINLKASSIQPKSASDAAERESIYYVTDRQKLFNAGGSCEQPTCYGNDRAKTGQISYGSVEMKPVDSPGNPPTIGTIQELDRDMFFDKLIRDGTSVLIFIHGFANSFRSGLLDLAALRRDLGFKGPLLIFSWASRDEFGAYFDDESTIEWSTQHFRGFLEDLSHKRFKEVDFMAHSMGNRLLIRGLETCQSLFGSGQVIFVAPDVDADTFQQAVNTLSPTMRHLTMYASRYDNALAISQALHSHPRAGLLDSHAIPGGVDTVDISDVDPTFLHHSYLLESTVLEKDITELLKGAYPPNRSHLQRRTAGNPIVWRLEAP